MENKTVDKWERPWNIEKFDDLYNRDERFFAIVMKGALAWLNRNILLYNKSINHYIFNSGSGYLYIEQEGYKFTFAEATGEDQMYNELPRAIVVMSGVSVDSGDMSQPFARGTYERRSGTTIKGYNAEIKRVPIEIEFDVTYYLATFNEFVVLLQEFIDKIIFQKYFKITYLGQVIDCAIEMPSDFSPELNQIDYSNPTPMQNSLKLDIKITTNYPVINERTEVENSSIISNVQYNTAINVDSKQSPTGKANLDNETIKY